MGLVGESGVRWLEGVRGVGEIGWEGRSGVGGVEWGWGGVVQVNDAPDLGRHNSEHNTKQSQHHCELVPRPHVRLLGI